MFEQPLRWLYRLLRRMWPVAVLPRPLLSLLLTLFGYLPRIVLVSRRDHVLEVLARNRDFSVALYDQRFRATGGPFLLGMDDDAQYRHEVGAARQAIAPGDLARIRRFADELSERIVDKAVHGPGRIDAIAELVNVVPVAFVGDYFGVPEPDPARPSLLIGFQTASYYMFNLEVLTDTPLVVAAARAGRAIGRHLESTIAARKRALAAGATNPPDDLLGRFLALQSDAQTRLEDGRIRDTLAGIISGTLVPTIGLVGDAISTLLDMSAELRADLTRACRENDDDRVWRFIREAGRYNPFPPILYRYCELDTKIGEGTKREKRVPAGALVVALISSAALDDEAVEKPNEFRPDRPDSEYLLFGHGQHECLGATGNRHLAQALMVGMVKAIFRRDFKRMRGDRGKLNKRRASDIPPLCPESMMLTLHDDE